MWASEMKMSIPMRISVAEMARVSIIQNFEISDKTLNSKNELNNYINLYIGYISTIYSIFFENFKYTNFLYIVKFWNCEI